MPPPVPTALPCPTQPRVLTATTVILSAPSAKPYLPSSSSRDSAPHRSTSLPRHRAPPLFLLTLLPCRHSSMHRATRQVTDCLSVTSSSLHRLSPSVSDQPSTRAVLKPLRRRARSRRHLLSTVNTSTPLAASGHPPGLTSLPRALSCPRAPRRPTIRVEPWSGVPRRTCCLLHRESASTPTARLRPGPPLLRPL
jgi:hypothetical protein